MMISQGPGLAPVVIGGRGGRRARGGLLPLHLQQAREPSDRLAPPHHTHILTALHFSF